jgi:hypothetical protein
VRFRLIEREAAVSKLQLTGAKKSERRTRGVNAERHTHHVHVIVAVEIGRLRDERVAVCDSV